ncbi:hypothetical protein [Spirosoma fluviale]|uniref:Uncharacterized protein n=1 Tax=Spirosoma fluviale TaxID=1597977 RepID=A0A286G2W3_9BACT|nr:hypothetical protein [Spirosoma fluviale]SOD89865.1 hypothetical protein SAMN06269250_3217 [Spirosoma fluviale]
MMKLVIGVMLLATTAMAQTAPKGSTAGSGSTKSTTANATKPKAMSAASPRSNKPIPPPSQKDNLESKNSALPSYKKEKDAGVQKTRNRYEPRRTDSGARKDTLIRRRKTQ